MAHAQHDSGRCPSSADLDRFAQQLLEPQDSAVVQAHLQVCGACRQIVEDSRSRFQRELATADLVTPISQLANSTAKPSGATDRPEPASRRAAPANSIQLLERYELGTEIARGGMGTVYRAIDQQFEREVAIKLLRPRWSDIREPALQQLRREQAIESFRYEAKVTARLQHPAIPPVYEQGTVADGLPFLSMKLIQGKTLQALLKLRASPHDDLPRWLQVFEQIAHAVGYAHQQGIIHRDLKPLNVMVGEFGEVQVMDWGLAKEVGGAETPAATIDLAEPTETLPLAEGERAFVSQPGDIKGTLQYMSPEQARGEVGLLDARADVFGLGAILCQILTGEPPYRGGSVLDLREAAASGDLQTATSRLHASGHDPELVALALQCLAVNAGERPATGTAVAEAIAAYRAGVEERLRKAETERALGEQRLVEQSRRRKLWYGIAAAAILFAIASSSLAVVYARSNVIIADREEKAKQAAELAAAREVTARQELTISTAVGEFLQNDLLALAGAEEQAEAKLEVNPDLKVRDLVLRAAGKIEGRFVKQPLVEARIRWTIGKALLAVGEPAQTIVQQRRAIAIYARELGDDHPYTLHSRNNLAIALRRTGQLDEAIKMHEENLRLRQKQFGPDHADVADSLFALGIAHHAAGRFQKATPLFEQTYQMRKRLHGPQHHETLTALGMVGQNYVRLGAPDRALPLLQDAYRELNAQLGPRDPRVISALENLASAHWVNGNKQEALASYEEVVRLSRETLGDQHPSTLSALVDLGANYREAQQFDRARPLLEEAHQQMTAQLGADHHDTLHALVELATVLSEMGRREQAIELLEEHLPTMQKKLGENHPETLGAMNALAISHFKLRHFDRTIALLQEVLARSTETLGPTHYNTLSTAGNLAEVYEQAGKLQEAHEVRGTVLQSLRKQKGDEHPKTLEAIFTFAISCIELGNLEQGITLLEEAQKLSLRIESIHPSAQRSILNNLAVAYSTAKRWDDAIRAKSQLLKLDEIRLGKHHPSTFPIVQSQIDDYLAAGQLNKAVTALEELLVMRKEKQGIAHAETLATHLLLAETLFKLPEPERSLPQFAEVTRLHREKYGPAGNETAKAVTTHAIALGKLGQWDRALPLLDEVHQALEEKFGPEHDDSLRALRHRCLAYRDAGQLDTAAQHLQRAIELQTKHTGAGSDQTLLLGLELAFVKIRLKQFEEAKTDLQKTWAAAQKSTSPNKNRLLHAISQRSAEEYEAANQPEAAQEWRQELEKLSPP